MRTILRVTTITVGIAETVVVVCVVAMFSAQSGDPLTSVIDPDLLMIVALPYSMLVIPALVMAMVNYWGSSTPEMELAVG